MNMGRLVNRARPTVLAFVTVLAGGFLAACADNGGAPEGAGSASPWNHPPAALRFTLVGSDLPARTGETDSNGDLVTADGQRRQLSTDTRAALQEWLADPSRLTDAAADQTCDLGADVPQLAITIADHPEVPQPITICLWDDNRSPYRDEIDAIANALRS